MATPINPGHLKIGLCAGLVYAGSTLVVPRLMPGSTLARVMMDSELSFAVGAKTIMCAIFGSYLATSAFNVVVTPPPGGFGMGFF